MKSKKLWVVGIGPGSKENMTLRAIDVLESCDIICGYTVYCDLVKPYFPNKEYLSTPMMGEEKRVAMALQKADEGNHVALICSGDAGVYGMSGLSYELGRDFPEVEIEVVPGVTAAISGAAILGAPLIHDFSVISLSDRLTSMELIEKRLRAAARSDMVIVLYNPESRSRKGYLSHACDILLETIPGDRVCGIARNIGRDGQRYEVMKLLELKYADADMFCTVFIGNSSTKNNSDVMVTARGYRGEKSENVR